MEQGLAQMATQAEPTGITVEQVAQLLMENVPPEDLMAQGVPPELIEQAIRLIQSQQQQQEQNAQPAQTETGLAMSAAQGM